MKETFLSYLVIALLFVRFCEAEFQVNTHTSNDQTYSSVATDGQGTFLIVWSSYRQDGDKGGIFGQRFGLDGSPLGGEFQINTTTSGHQTEPSATMNAAGDFVVVWQSKIADDEDIYAQRFSSDGNAIGGEFLVNDNPNGRQLHPEVSMSSAGSFVIVWENNEYWPSFDYYEILFKLYDCNSTVIEANSTNLLSQCRYPDVAMDGNGNGNFTIVWMQDDIYHSSNIVMARPYNADGTAKADPYEVSTSEFDSLTQISISMADSGHFIVTWDGNPGSASEDNILARRYKFDGTAITDEFVVNTTLAGTQRNPEVAMNNQREFVIVWDSEPVPGTNHRDILCQRYNSQPVPVGDELKINTYVVDDQKYPEVAIREDGRFITAWQSDGQDGSGWGVFAEAGPKIYCADFSGDGFVNFYDYCILAQEWLEEGNPLQADLVDDNRIDEQDLGAFCAQWLMPCYQCSRADIYSDGKIDFKDYCLLANNWQKEGSLAGDITGDGTVDIEDLQVLVFHWAVSCE